MDVKTVVTAKLMGDRCAKMNPESKVDPNNNIWFCTNNGIYILNQS